MITARELTERAARFAEGVREGERVAIEAAPPEETAARIVGAMLAGGVAEPVAPACARAGAGGGVAGTVRPERSSAEGGAKSKDVVTRAPEQILALLRAALSRDADAPALAVHTSGTTAAPRRILLPRRALLAQAALSSARHATGPEDTWLLALPLHHVAGIAVVARAVLDGSALEVHPRFDAEAVARALASGRVTRVSLVARQVARTLDALAALGLRPSPALRTALVGGGPTPEPLLERARAAGLPVARTYGLTEACATVATQAPGEAGPSCGRPLEGIEVRIDRDRAGDEGEVLVRGPTLHLGVAPGGWLRTGDFGRLDAEGRLHIVDRRADLIVSGGENVSPARVEAALEEHPGVAEACAVGAPDPEWGQRVAAVVSLRAGAAPGLAEHARRRLLPHERPRVWLASGGPLPRTAGGKLRRAEVRARLETYEALDSAGSTADASAAR